MIETTFQSLFDAILLVMNTPKKISPTTSSTKAWAKKFVKQYKPALKELAKK